MNTSPLKTPLYQELYQELRGKIISGEYPVGSQIPTEKQIAASHGVSRITSKHALDRLVSEGYIKRFPGRGSFVHSQTGTPAQVSAPAPADGQQSNPSLIGVVMEGISYDFGVEILAGIEHQCAQAGYSLVLKYSYGSEEREIACVNELLAAGVSGILLMCVYSEVYSPTVMKLALEGFPLIFMDRTLRGLPISYVGTNHLAAAKDLVDGLVRRGHTHLALVMLEDSHTTSSAEDRTLGYIEACIDHGLSCASKRLYLAREGEFQTDEEIRQSNIGRIQAFMRENPETTAFLALTARIGTALVQALTGSASERFAIASFDGPKDLRSLPCELLYVQQDQRQIGSISCVQLIEKMRGRSLPHLTHVPHRIISAGSAKPASEGVPPSGSHIR